MSEDTQWRIFVGIGSFIAVIAVIYWFVSYEAAGTVMLGEPPRTAEFERQFDWPDAVIPLPFDSPDVGRLLTELDQDPARVARIRRDNVANGALRHDWVHRMRAVFETLGLKPTEAMRERERCLQSLAAGLGP